MVLHGSHIHINTAAQLFQKNEGRHTTTPRDSTGICKKTEISDCWVNYDYQIFILKATALQPPLAILGSMVPKRFAIDQ